MFNSIGVFSQSFASGQFWARIYISSSTVKGKGNFDSDFFDFHRLSGNTIASLFKYLDSHRNAHTATHRQVHTDVDRLSGV